MKKLIINNCNQCPHFKVSEIHGIDDSYRATCNHPDIDSVDWSVKRGRDAYIPLFCPLPENVELDEFFNP